MGEERKLDLDAFLRPDSRQDVAQLVGPVGRDERSDGGACGRQGVGETDVVQHLLDARAVAVLAPDAALAEVRGAVPELGRPVQGPQGVAGLLAGSDGEDLVAREELAGGGTERGDDRRPARRDLEDAAGAHAGRVDDGVHVEERCVVTVGGEHLRVVE